MERINFEVYDWLKEHQKENNYSDQFIEAYKECYFLNRLSGKFFLGTYAGYSVKPDNSDKSYFVEDGIRGQVKGYFTVLNGKLIQLDPLSDIQNYDKYTKLKDNLHKYMYTRLENIEILRKIYSDRTDEIKTQIDDRINSLNTIIYLLSKY